MAEAIETGGAEAPPPITPDLIGELIWDARRLAKARAEATLDVVVVETRDRPRSIVNQDPPPGEPLPEDKVIRVEVSHGSWIRNLPGIYQDSDEENADFLKRFLGIQQHLSLQIEEKLETVHTFFDPRETPEGFLPWLASWVALSLHEGWSEQRRREVIVRATEMYRKRGTAEGLKLYLRLFAETEADVEEFTWPYPGFVVGAHAVIGHQSTIARPVFKTQCFVVKLPVKKSEISREKLRTVHSVIESEKPAHAHYALEFHEETPTWEAVPFLQFGKHSRIGVDVRIAGKTDVPELDHEQIAARAHEQKAASS